MKLAIGRRTSLLPLLAFPANNFAATNQDPTTTTTSSAATCNCQPFPPKHSSYQVTTLWNIVDPSTMSNQDVINEFNNGFAPLVTNMPGFQRYTSSFTGGNNSTNTVFFLNQFDTQEQAHAAQEAAKEFVANNPMLNNGTITPNIFTEIQVIYGAAADSCVTSSSKGDYLAVRFYNFDDPDSLNTTMVYTISDNFYETTLKDSEGFVAYSNAAEVGVKENAVWDIFTTEEQAIQSNEDASKLVLPDWVSRAGSAAGMIVFDYTCAAGNIPAAPTTLPETGVPEDESTITTTPDNNSSAAISTSVSGASTVTVAAATFMLLWKAL